MKKSPLTLLVLFTALFALVTSGFAPASLLLSPQQRSGTCDQAILHYRRVQGDYEGWGLHVWGPTSETVTWDDPLQPAGTDDYGVYWTVGMQAGADVLNYIVHKGDQKDPGPDQTLVFADKGCEIWLVEGQGTQFADPESAKEALIPNIAESPPPGENQVIVHYRRSDGNYAGWGMHVWGPVAENGVTWSAPLLPAGQDEYGVFWIINMEEGGDVLNYIVHKGDEKDPGPDQSLDIGATGNEIWLIQGSGEQFNDPETAREALLAAGVGDIKNKAQAYWLTMDTIAWPVPFGPKAIYELHFDLAGSIRVTQTGLQGGQTITLDFADDELDPDLAEKYPYIRHAIELKIPGEYLDQVPEILKGQFAVTVTAPDGSILGATALQIAGVLDDLYANNEPLGVTWKGETPMIRVWAPTAKSVRLQLFPDPLPDTKSTAYAMDFNQDTGIWSIIGEPDWKYQYYLFEVNVFVRQEGKVVQNLVTDPYSLSLSMDSARSQVVDLNDPALAPEGWDSLEKPRLNVPEDIVIYELHLRDFSATDPSVPPEHRGTYLAFTHPDSNGMRHLKHLAEAGLTHVHLLPVFDIATVEEDKSLWLKPDFDQLATYPPDSEEQQAILMQTRGKDGYNWGYDPWHYTTPEGSYATDPQGAARILEFRKMVMALNGAGLRVIMDVVYNHTNAAGQSEKSVLDKIVPGYYHRLDSNGNVTTSTCCPNTATENAMMEKLMLDSTLTWAKAYKIDGFRFDLMGHHMLSNMLDVQAALNSLTVQKDGVDGSSIYIYGEGWNFGEVADNARGVNANQFNTSGTGIGTFNDRIRDAVRGGSPFSGLQEQGFATGLYTNPNGADTLPPQTQLSKLLELTDQIRVSLAGNLASYPLENAAGLPVTGAQIGYNGLPAGYTQDPQENVAYVSSHDNETLFDAILYKAPLSMSVADRARMQSLALSIVALSQGVPFFQAGSDLLRSKSLDRDSYDSGDWFNRLDFTYTTNNWGAGLPPKDKNESNWPLMRNLLGRADLRPNQSDILATANRFVEMLRIRKSSPLFRLRTADQVIQKVRFYNTGPDQVPGLIVMGIDDTGANPLDKNYDFILVFFNAGNQAVKFTIQDLSESAFKLHPIQQESTDARLQETAYDPKNGAFQVPALTTTVFVRLRSRMNPTADATAVLSLMGERNTATPSSAPVGQEVKGSDRGWQIYLTIGTGMLLLAVLGFALNRRIK